MPATDRYCDRELRASRPLRQSARPADNLILREDLLAQIVGVPPAAGRRAVTPPRPLHVGAHLRLDSRCGLTRAERHVFLNAGDRRGAGVRHDGFLATGAHLGSPGRDTAAHSGQFLQYPAARIAGGPDRSRSGNREDRAGDAHQKGCPHAETGSHDTEPKTGTPGPPSWGAFVLEPVGSAAGPPAVAPARGSRPRISVSGRTEKRQGLPLRKGTPVMQQDAQGVPSHEATPVHSTPGARPVARIARAKAVVSRLATLAR